MRLTVFFNKIRIEFIKTVYRLFFLVMKLVVRPRDNYVAFFSLPDYSDNARVLSEYMENKEKYRIFWCVENRKAFESLSKQHRVTFISSKKNRYGWHSFSTYFRLYRCKYLFYTHFSIMNKRRRSKKQVVINLWHGCGYKDSETNNAVNSVFDYALVPGTLFVGVKSVFWGAPVSAILPIGYPRYDLFFKSPNKQILDKYKVNSETKVVVWMPTFRKSVLNTYPENRIMYNYDFPLMSNINDLLSLDEYCEKLNISLVVKRHPFQAKYSFEGGFFKRIKIVSNESLETAGVQLYELLSVTDALISDYSSVAIDYLLLDKLIAFSLDDFDSYKNARGFVFEKPLDYMPGHHLFNYNDLVSFLEDVSVGKDMYKEMRHQMVNVMHNPCSNYCQRICDYFNL